MWPLSERKAERERLKKAERAGKPIIDAADKVSAEEAAEAAEAAKSTKKTTKSTAWG